MILSTRIDCRETREYVERWFAKFPNLAKALQINLTSDYVLEFANVLEAQITAKSLGLRPFEIAWLHKEGRLHANEFYNFIVDKQAPVTVAGAESTKQHDLIVHLTGFIVMSGELKDDLYDLFKTVSPDSTVRIFDAITALCLTHLMPQALDIDFLLTRLMGIYDEIPKDRLKQLEQKVLNWIAQLETIEAGFCDVKKAA